MPTPTPPQAPDPHARAVLEGLGNHPEAAALVLGGAFALKHYLDYRDTHDLDAWWAADATPARREAAKRAIHAVLAAIAAAEGLRVSERAWSDVVSMELTRPPSGKTLFSVQIAARDRFLEPPLPSAWPPLRIEGLSDTLASKMTALVNRGAPRDMVDIFMVHREGIATLDELWALWRARNPSQAESGARARIRLHLAALEARRPLANVAAADRARAGAVRDWLRDDLAAPSHDQDRER